MTGRKCTILTIACIGTAGAAVGTSLLRDDPSADCANVVQQRIVAPDAKHEVVLFERDCGATTDFSIQLSVVARATTLPN